MKVIGSKIDHMGQEPYNTPREMCMSVSSRTADRMDKEFYDTMIPLDTKGNSRMESAMEMGA